ncbi:hypothetical protein GCM10011342_27310 [Aquisalinus flavus]|uniref:TonB-dependent receptor n=1 Tax=Aquisalinus flavus TaxID=1526572 RepID=A0A8J2V309_9PROT|nr:hypothetical protein GCM10011342_27310 [Aquisalinus flavus]
MGQTILNRLAVAGFSIAALGAACPAWAANTQAQTIRELQSLSLEQLGQIEVTSVAKHATPLSRAPAAIYVITSEDIRRAGANSIPEALRLAPNLLVAQANSALFAISARGFNSYESSNKLLAMIDGRSIYTPLHGGVFWDQQQLLMADVERIEVISGAAGTLWGANAFNGVINIITKSAAETQGGLAVARAGIVDSDLSVRYGGRLGENTAWRAYGMAIDRGETNRPDGEGRGDGWDGLQGGLRLDWSGTGSEVSLHADVFEFEQAADLIVKGRSVMGKWSTALSPDTDLNLQAYYDAVERNYPVQEAGETSDRDELETADIEGRIVSRQGRHTVVAGAGHRVTDDLFEVRNLSFFYLAPASETVEISNVFIQDEIALSEALSLAAGLKYEHSSFSGGELLPSIRLAWQVSDRALLWSSITRAVRTPSRVDRNIVGDGILERAGDFGSEEVIAYEAGYRGHPTANTSLSVSVYYNDYDDLRALMRSDSGLLQFGNAMEGAGYGLEAWGDWQATEWWTLSAGANFLAKDLDLKEGGTTFAIQQHQGTDPDYQWQLRSHLALSPAVSFDAGLRGVDDLEYVGIDGYVEADARLSWALNEDVELSLTARNLLDDQHPESGSPGQRGEIRREVRAGLRARF